MKKNVLLSRKLELFYKVLGVHSEKLLKEIAKRENKIDELIKFHQCDKRDQEILELEEEIGILTSNYQQEVEVLKKKFNFSEEEEIYLANNSSIDFFYGELVLVLVKSSEIDIPLGTPMGVN